MTVATELIALARDLAGQRSSSTLRRVEELARDLSRALEAAEGNEAELAAVIERARGWLDSEPPVRPVDPRTLLAEIRGVLAESPTDALDAAKVAARAEQVEEDAAIADRIKHSHFPGTMGWAAAERVAEEIRAQHVEAEPGHSTAAVAADAVTAAAEAFPLITRDMVSRGQVRRWLLGYAQKIRSGETPHT